MWWQRGSIFVSVVSATAIAACGDDGAGPAECEAPPAFVVGDATGHPSPLGAGPTEARAGRVRPGDLPVVASGLATWKDGDFVLANDRVALVIEDVGDSDLYDPWGGRPVGVARVVGGRLVEPTNFGELFLLTGRASIITEDVSVIADGSDGGPAIIRTVGTLHPVPFFASVTQGIFEDLLGVPAAIDYELAPGADHVDVRYRYLSTSLAQTETGGILHAMMYTERTPVFVPGRGFTNTITNAPYLALVDAASTSWGYVPTDTLLSGLAVSGFVGGLAPGFRLPACTAFDRIHAQIVIGRGPGLDGVVAAMADVRGDAVRAITGTVIAGGTPVAAAHVHAIDTTSGAYYTRGRTDATGAFTVHVPSAATVRLDAVVDASQLASATAAPGGGAVTIALPAPAQVHVIVRDDDDRIIPARVQILPGAGQARPFIPATYGEERFAVDRLRVLHTDGDVVVPVPPGTWEIVVSRGYEYALSRRTLTVTAGQTLQLDAVLAHQVDTVGTQCGDFHVHTSRSNDSGDDGLAKVASAIADGVELPVRSDHEYVGDFAAEIAALGAQQWAAGFASIELTSFELWGHMGVFPLTPRPAEVNSGAPRWQTFPTADAPETAFATLSPLAVFDAVRARPEAPVVIINHPRGNTNYFGYVGYDAATGTATATADWDTRFTLVEVFNDTNWRSARNGIVEDWLGLLRAGRKVFAVGSSDSHSLASSPIGYPRTCLALGTDDPRALTASQVRDALAAGHGTVSGGIYVAASIGAAQPGDTAAGLGDAADVAVVVQAADWIDVDAIDVVVDGVTVDTIAIAPGDADPGNPTVRWRGTIPIDVRAAGGGFVVIAAYGNAALEPVHPGRIPFGVTNPIFVSP